jgi:hypothetical protein
MTKKVIHLTHTMECTFEIVSFVYGDTKYNEAWRLIFSYLSTNVSFVLGAVGKRSVLRTLAVFQFVVIVRALGRAHRIHTMLKTSPFADRDRDYSTYILKTVIQQLFNYCLLMETSNAWELSDVTHYSSSTRIPLKNGEHARDNSVCFVSSSVVLDNNIKCNTNLLIASKLGEALFTEFAKSYRKELSLPESDVTIFKDNLLLELHSITLEDMTQDDSIDDLALVLMPDDARVVSISPSYRRESQLVRSQGITPTQQFFYLRPCTRVTMFIAVSSR